VPKPKNTKLSVFKGREARLNHTIFQTLTHGVPLTIYEIHRQIKTQRGLRHTKYTNVSRRVKALEDSGYIDKAGTRNTQAGAQATLYQLTTRAQVALFLSQISPDTFIKEADEDTLIAQLAALTLFFEKTSQKDKTKD
jgi:DNA-binding MarR family transcriptional regulator